MTDGDARNTRMILSNISGVCPELVSKPEFSRRLERSGKRSAGMTDWASFDAEAVPVLVSKCC